MSLPRSKIINNDRTHFVLVNSQNTVRELALDKNSQVSFNISSLVSEVTSSEPNMARLSPLPSHDKYSVKFMNTTG